MKKLQNQYLHNNTGDGTLLQATPGGTGTRPKAGGAHEILQEVNSFFCYSWFRLQLMAIHCNRREVETGTTHTSFFSCTVRTLNDVHSHRGSRMCLCASPILMVIHVVRLIDRVSLSVPRLVPFRVSLLPFALLFPLLPVLCPEPLLPCGQRQGNKPRHLRQLMRFALWQNSPLTHEGWSVAQKVRALSSGESESTRKDPRQREVTSFSAR